MSGGSSAPAPSGATTTTQTTNPWSGQIPYLNGTGDFSGTSEPSGNIPGTNTPYSTSGTIAGTLPTAAELYSNYAPSYYPGATYAPETSSQSSAISQIEGMSNPASQPVIGSDNTFTTDLLNGSYLNSNPASSIFSGLASSNPAATTPGNSTLTNFSNGDNMAVANPNTSSLAASVGASVLPQVQSAFGNAFQSDNPAMAYAASQGMASGLAPSMFSQYNTEEGNTLNAANELNTNSLTGTGLQEQAATGLSNPYQETLQNMTQGTFTAPSAESLLYAPANEEYSAGTTEQGLNQNVINDAVTRYNYNETLPYNLYDNYAGSINGNYGGSTTLSTPYYTNSSANTLEDALGGAALGGIAGNTLLGSSTGGSAVGGLLGLLMSDRRFKRDVRRIGTHHNGLPIYRFRFIGLDDTVHVGFMADEVRKVRPHAVVEGPLYDMVDYALAME